VGAEIEMVTSELESAQGETEIEHLKLWTASSARATFFPNRWTANRPIFSCEKLLDHEYLDLVLHRGRVPQKNTTAYGQRLVGLPVLPRFIAHRTEARHRYMEARKINGSRT